jgi:hypothetical protein
MKVLNKPDETWSTMSGCLGCETLVQLFLIDLRYVYDQRDGDAVTWNCPTCKRRNWISATLVPSNLHHLILH